MPMNTTASKTPRTSKEAFGTSYQQEQESFEDKMDKLVFVVVIALCGLALLVVFTVGGAVK